MKYLILMLLFFSSCRTVNKLFHKEKLKVDSTEVKHNVFSEEKHIDTSKSSQIVTSKGNSIEIDLETDNDNNQFDVRSRNIDSNIIQTPVSIHDYFLQVDRKTGKITSNQPITHVTIKGLDEIKYSNFIGGIDSSTLKQISSDSTHVQKQSQIITKTVTKKVSFTTVIYWGIAILFLLILLYLIYRYRNQIKSFVLKITTGL